MIAYPSSGSGHYWSEAALVKSPRFSSLETPSTGAMDKEGLAEDGRGGEGGWGGSPRRDSSQCLGRTIELPWCHDIGFPLSDYRGNSVEVAVFLWNACARDATGLLPSLIKGHLQIDS